MEEKYGGLGGSTGEEDVEKGYEGEIAARWYEGGWRLYYEAVGCEDMMYTSFLG